MISASDIDFLKRALRLARRGYGNTSPNPMVGAVLVNAGRIIGSGWHRQAGLPHAEIEALEDARARGSSARGATLYVTLEPCCTLGRTPPCTESIRSAGIRRVVAGATDPNPQHAGRGSVQLKRDGIKVEVLDGGVANIGPASDRAAGPGARRIQALALECSRLNEGFNHWMVHRQPFVTIKAAMTLDGKIATSIGESKWITSLAARAIGRRLRQGADAVLVGVNTILADDPTLTCRVASKTLELRRIVLDAMARTPLTTKVVTDEFASRTTVVVSLRAPKQRVKALARRVNVIVAPLVRSTGGSQPPAIEIRWLLRKLGEQNVTNLLVEGGGEINASFLMGGFANRVAFFYAPTVLGGRDSRKAVAGNGALRWTQIVRLQNIQWHLVGPDLLLTAHVVRKGARLRDIR